MKRFAVVQMAGSPCVRLRKVINSLPSKNIVYVGCERNEKEPIDHSRASLRYVRPKIPSKSFGKFFFAPLWIFNVAMHLRYTRYDIVYAADLEAGLAAYLAGRPYIYDVLDTYADRYRVPEFIRTIIRAVESHVFCKAALPIHVSKHRHATLRSNEEVREKTLTIPNTPLREDLPTLSVQRSFDIIATGNIDASRGCDTLLEVSQALGMSVCVVGKISPDLYKRFYKVERFTFLPYCTSTEALALCAKAKAIYCAYDPSLPINVLAAPNKIYDSIFCGTPIIINSEVLISKEMELLGIARTFIWKNNISLKEALLEIGSEIWNKKIVAAQRLSEATPTWENAFEPVVHWIQKNC